MTALGTATNTSFMGYTFIEMGKWAEGGAKVCVSVTKLIAQSVYVVRVLLQLSFKLDFCMWSKPFDTFKSWIRLQTSIFYVSRTKFIAMREVVDLFERHFRSHHGANYGSDV